MALSVQDKECIRGAVEYLSSVGPRSDFQESKWTDLLTGTETERIAAAKWYAGDVAAIDKAAKVTFLLQKKADIEASIAALEAEILELDSYANS